MLHIPVLPYFLAGSPNKNVIKHLAAVIRNFIYPLEIYIKPPISGVSAALLLTTCYKPFTVSLICQIEINFKFLIDYVYNKSHTYEVNRTFQV